jgi:uncharacterized protein with PIN domain
MKRSRATKLQDEYPRFIADSMLGSISRKLRIIGYDTVYARNNSDKDLVKIALDTGRILLTSDKMLYKNALSKGALAILLRGKDDDRKRLSEIRKWLNLADMKKPTETTRCALCNSELERVKKSEIEGIVPENVSSKHREFFICRKCSKVYWRGTHWKRLRSLIYNFTRM